MIAGSSTSTSFFLNLQGPRCLQPKPIDELPTVPPCVSTPHPRRTLKPYTTNIIHIDPTTVQRDLAITMLAKLGFLANRYLLGTSTRFPSSSIASQGSSLRYSTGKAEVTLRMSPSISALVPVGSRATERNAGHYSTDALSHRDEAVRN
ncbi:hypothetical protein GX50_07660 [[Emmonsia] crescens]|uniref:Uncharacterized protein n=1 Tax=[Emmonsia] crescens TaxID=73230 RepID=A0A2B7Z998_9EURO|nr:hypothetical protein GX50_07660 [Emmonsia crescens]